ncbi:MAG: SurA N-terminal domain-containing protein [Proteobacteria bacterium]|nr:SurA N-terminal domain-containing protein [Pseudomonadota bacterium]
MLQALRKQTGSWIVKILLGLLILSFAVWGINDIFLGERDPVVAEVGGVKITSSELEREFRRELARVSPMFGGRLDREQAKQLGLLDGALDGLIDRVLFSLGTRDLGVAVSEELVRRTIHANPAFHDDRGRFDRRLFANVLFQNNFTEDGYVSVLKENLARSQLTSAVASFSQVPRKSVEAIYRYRQERRIAEHVLVPAASVTGVGVPDRTAIEEFYKAHSGRYMAPEYRAVTYVSLDPDSLAAEIRVSDDKLREAYEARRDEFTARERRQVDQIVLTDEATARRAHGFLLDGRNFPSIVKQLGDGKTNLISLGWVERSDLLPELADPTFALKDGEVTDPVKSSLGWHILRVTASENKRVRTLDEVREKIRQDIARDLALDGISEFANGLEDALAGGASLEEAAGKLDLKAVKIKAIDGKGQTPEGKPVDGLAGDGAFLKLAFATPRGEESPLTETEAGGYMILRVDAITRPEPKPIESVRQKIVTAWQTEQRAKKAKERAEAILERVAAGEKLSAIAAEQKLAFKITPPFDRTGQDRKLGALRVLVAKLFASKPGETVVGEAPGGAIVARLTEVKPAQPSADKKTVDATRDSLRQGIASDLLEQFTGALRQRYSVEIKRKTIESRF